MKNLITFKIGETKKILCGEVTKIEESTYKNKEDIEFARMTLTISGEVYDAQKKENVVENITLIMSDSDYSMQNFDEYPDGRLNDSTMLVTRWKSRGYKEGDYVSFLCSESGEKIYVQNFKKSGQWKYVSNDKEYNVLIGTIIPSKHNKRNDEEGFRVWNASIPISQGMDNPSKFIQLAFWNTPATDEYSENLMANRASKSLYSTTDDEGNTSYKKAVLLTGPINESINEESGYKNYQTSVRRFYRLG